MTNVSKIHTIFGEFRENIPETYHEYLKLGFSPTALTVQQRWRTNGLSADFVADYLTTFLRVHDVEDNEAKQEEVKDAVSFISNELLENAMKFNYEPNDQPIQFNLHLLPGMPATVVLSVTNGISLAGLEKLQAFIQEFLATDPDEFYMRQLEVAAEDAETSGLGFITIRNDYPTSLGWKFEALEAEPEQLTVTTMVQLRL